MTNLQKRKTSLSFETADQFQGRAIVVECEPTYAVVRLKGTRTRFTLTWAGIYCQAAKRAAEVARKAKS